MRGARGNRPAGTLGPSAPQIPPYPRVPRPPDSSPSSPGTFGPPPPPRGPRPLRLQSPIPTLRLPRRPALRAGPPSPCRRPAPRAAPPHTRRAWPGVVGEGGPGGAGRRRDRPAHLHRGGRPDGGGGDHRVPRGARVRAPRPAPRAPLRPAPAQPQPRPAPAGATARRWRSPPRPSPRSFANLARVCELPSGAGTGVQVFRRVARARHPGPRPRLRSAAPPSAPPPLRPTAAPGRRRRAPSRRRPGHGAPTETRRRATRRPRPRAGAWVPATRSTRAAGRNVGGAHGERHFSAGRAASVGASWAIRAAGGAAGRRRDRGDTPAQG